MPKTDEKGNWIDSAGNIVPVKYVKAVDKQREKMLDKLMREARRVNQALVRLRELSDAEISAFLFYASKDAGLKANPGGNYTFTGFSGDIQVEVKQAEFISFDEQLQFAKKLIDGCISRWTEGAKDEIRLIINDAFKTNKKGRIYKNRLFGLKKLKIKDAEWIKAMDLISESATVRSKKAYITFRERDNKGNWQAIKLDIAGV